MSSYSAELEDAVSRLEQVCGVRMEAEKEVQPGEVAPEPLSSAGDPTTVDRPVWVALVHLLALMWPEQALCLAPLLNVAGAVPVTGTIDPDTQLAVVHVVNMLYPGGIVINTYYPCESIALWQSTAMRSTYGEIQYPLGDRRVGVQPVALPAYETPPGSLGYEKLSWLSLHPQNVVQSALNLYLNHPLEVMYAPAGRPSFEPPPIQSDRRSFGKWRSFLHWVART